MKMQKKYMSVEHALEVLPRANAIAKYVNEHVPEKNYNRVMEKIEHLGDGVATLIKNLDTSAEGILFYHISATAMYIEESEKIINSLTPTVH